MSLDDLKQAGVLLPEDQWGKHELHTTVNRPVLLALGAAAAASALMMYLGDGRTLTWLGAGLFLLTMVVFTGMSLRAVTKQQEE